MAALVKTATMDVTMTEMPHLVIEIAALVVLVLLDPPQLKMQLLKLDSPPILQLNNS
jgi:hypothetical protein